MARGTERKALRKLVAINGLAAEVGQDCGGEWQDGGEPLRKSERIVLTGFRGFPGVADNPTQLLLEAIAARPSLLPAGAEFRLLETAYAAIPLALEDILREPPAALVMTGYSALARCITLERVARDWRSPDIADAAGYYPLARVGAAVERSENIGCDFGAVAAALVKRGLGCRFSDDAGQYVCNGLYHAALSRIAELRLGTRAIFVHVPAVEGTPLAERSTGSMPLDEMMRGVALIARVLAG